MKYKYKLAFMDMAERFGQTSTAERLKVGSIIVKNDSIISLGVNGTPPGWPTEVCEDVNGNTLPIVRHAEDAALQKLWNSHEAATGASIYISHAPCLMCSIKICTAKISHVYYRHDYRNTDGMVHLLENGVCVEQIK